MIQLPLNQLRSGMVTAQGIYNRYGTTYLTRGAVLSKQYIDRLRHIGIKNVAVTSLEPSIQIPPPADIIQEKTRVQAISQIYDTYSKLQQQENIELSPLLNASENILDDLISSPDNLLQMTDIRLYDDYTFAHSVNVSAISAMIGILCHFSKNDLLTLTLGALLHDIGKMDIPLNIINKPSSLTTTEMDFIRTHPEKGLSRLRNIDSTKLDIKIIAQIAHQHHEHIDGTGYPCRLDASKISDFAKIVAIADVYDALTTQRSYKKAYPPHVAYKIMHNLAGRQFDAQLLDLFFDHVALYPVGTVLKTALGYAIVKSIDIGRTRFPNILLFTNASGQKLPKPLHIKTYKQKPDFIISVVERNELYTISRTLNINIAKLITE